MKRSKILFFFLLFFFSACRKEQETLDPSWQRISKFVSFNDQGSVFKFKSGKNSYEIPKSNLPFKKIAVLNASLIGYISELEAEDQIVGVSSPEYIFSSKIHDAVTAHKIQNLGNEQRYDLEKIIALHPDAVFTNYIEVFSNTYDILRKQAIRIIFIDEYLEEDPLQKAKLLLLFGKLLGKEQLAEKKFTEISQRYSDLQKLTINIEERPVVIANEMYGNQWYMPGGKTSVAKLLKDAGADYIFKNDVFETTVPISFEEVMVKSANARFWVNLGNHHEKRELTAFNPSYNNLKVFRTGKLYSVAGAERNQANDYFERGVVHCEEILADYIYIFHPELLPNHRLRYLKELR